MKNAFRYKNEENYEGQVKGKTGHLIWIDTVLKNWKNSIRDFFESNLACQPGKAGSAIQEQGTLKKLEAHTSDIGLLRSALVCFQREKHCMHPESNLQNR